MVASGYYTLYYVKQKRAKVLNSPIFKLLPFMKPPKIYSILSKFLHNPSIPVLIPVINTPAPANFLEHKPYFLDCRMDFYIRKVLKHNGIKYSWHRKERILSVNYTGSPFKFFMIFEDNSNYITVRRIPFCELEYKINAITLDELFDKMVRFKIVYSLKYLIIPIHLKAQQLKLIYTPY